MSKEEVRLKYQVWHFPSVWPEEAKPHWMLLMNTSSLEDAFIKKIELENGDPDSQVLVTELLNLKVVVN